MPDRSYFESRLEALQRDLALARQKLDRAVQLVHVYDGAVQECEHTIREFDKEEAAARQPSSDPAPYIDPPYA